MESLAFLVAIIVLVTVLLGPISIMLSRLEPMSARIVCVSIATAGVGSGPTMMTSMPALVKPATSADSSI